MSYESIKAEINKLKLDFCSSQLELEALNELHNQFEKAGNASWTEDELTTELKQENDVLDSFDLDSAFYEDVRSIQDSIIYFFGETRKQKFINEIRDSGAKYVSTSVSNQPCAVSIAIRDIEGIDELPSNFEWTERSTGLDEEDYDY